METPGAPVCSTCDVAACSFESADGGGIAEAASTVS